MLERMLDEAPGFGRCPRCPYLGTGTVELCYRCARRTIEPLADLEDRCGVCDQVYGPDQTSCWNPVCRMDPGERWFEWNFAIAMRTNTLKIAINSYKYNGRRDWAAIFGRILIGFLEAEREVFKGIDLIVGSPQYTGLGAHRDWDHIREIMIAADREQEWPAWLAGWPFDLAEPPAIVKTADTPPMVKSGSAADRKHLAENDLRSVLQVPDRARTAGKAIAVLDDIFTGGWTLRESARALRLQGGARSVVGISLARQPYAPQAR